MRCEYKNADGQVDGIMCGKSGAYCSSDQWCIGDSRRKRSLWELDTIQDNNGCYSHGKIVFNK